MCTTIPPNPVLGPGVYSASNRNEYRKHLKEIKCGWGWQSYHHLRADCLDNVGSSTSHDPPRPVTGIAFPSLLHTVSAQRPSISAVEGNIVVYTENVTTHTDTFCGWNAEV
jgi:hypothetical protein